jgi:DNA-binding transcriptional LysR family regulator
MQLTHIRKSDLNLLPALAALLEERSISKAAARHHLSQPAMSRVLQRLRSTFGDELLVRTPRGYALTARARHLQEELEVLLPRIDRLLRGQAFDPAKAEDWFRFACPDYVSRLFAPPLAERLGRLAPRARLEIGTWHEGAADDAGRGKVDVLFWAMKAPAPLLSEQLLASEMVCVVCAKHPIGNRRLTLESYLSYPHVYINVMGSRPTIVDAALNASGHRRRIGLRVPYFGSSIVAVQNTSLIATVPRIAAEQYTREARVRILPSPFKFEPVRILMAWHPSTDGEPALQWFRAQVRDVAGQLA